MTGNLSIPHILDNDSNNQWVILQSEFESLKLTQNSLEGVKIENSNWNIIGAK